MPQDKLVFLNPAITWDGTPRTGEFNQVQLSLGAADVPLGNFGDKAELHGKGIRDHSVSWQVMPGNDHVYLDLLFDAFQSEDPVPVTLRRLDEPESATNPTYSFEVVVNSLDIGGNRGDAFSMSPSWPINGSVTVTNGSKTWTL